MLLSCRSASSIFVCTPNVFCSLTILFSFSFSWWFISHVKQACIIYFFPFRIYHVLLPGISSFIFITFLFHVKKLSIGLYLYCLGRLACYSLIRLWLRLESSSPSIVLSLIRGRCYSAIFCFAPIKIFFNAVSLASASISCLSSILSRTNCVNIYSIGFGVSSLSLCCCASQVHRRHFHWMRAHLFL